MSRQRGFVRSSVMDLLFLFVLILLGIGAWKWLSTIVSGDFALAFFLVWLMATATAWWWTREQRLVLRIPAGSLVFICGALLLVPLSWWSGSKLAVTAEAAVLTVGARYLGALWSGKIALRLQSGKPWFLDQSVNLIDDLARWMATAAVAWFVVGVLPMLLVFVLPVDWIVWGALLWALACTAWYCYKFRPSRVRYLKIPLGLWAFVAVAAVLQVLQKQILGPIEAGSIGLIAYVAYAPAVCALFAEIAVVGVRRPL
jgi:hypothetical protein